MDGIDSNPILPFIKQHAVVLGIGGLGLILIGYGLIQYFGTSPKQEQLPFEKSTGKASVHAATRAPAENTLTIDIEGAVKRPGVYMLPDKSRMQDAVLKAGGFASTADIDLIAKSLNMAAPLLDGTKVYVPKQGDTAASVQGGGAGAMGTSILNINIASEFDLDNLPGIGPTTAQKIIAGRPYVNPQDLVTKKVLTQKQFDKIKDTVTTY